MSEQSLGEPCLYRRIEMLQSILVEREADTPAGRRRLRFGGDIRIGDLDNDGLAELVVYRCQDGYGGEGQHPCFLAAIRFDGGVMWSAGRLRRLTWRVCRRTKGPMPAISRVPGNTTSA